MVADQRGRRVALLRRTPVDSRPAACYASSQRAPGNAGNTVCRAARRSPGATCGAGNAARRPPDPAWRFVPPIGAGAAPADHSCVALRRVWFFYTFLGLFKYEGLRGVDWVTPLIVGGLPVAFWLFKKPLDDLLLPLKPVIVAIPWVVRLGIVLAVPIFMGWVLNAIIFNSGYLGLQMSAFISVVTAGVLMRYR